VVDGSTTLVCVCVYGLLNQNEPIALTFRMLLLNLKAREAIIECWLWHILMDSFYGSIDFEHIQLR
jgi:hypothetical protein